LGVTWQLPEHDNETYSKDYLLDRLAILFGGRVAEELFMNLISTGASDDFNKATQTARAMVTRFGMTDALGPMVYADDENDGGPFGKGFTRAISEATQQKVDAEIRRVIDDQYSLARRLLDENRDKVEAMTAALMEWETIDADQINDIMAGRPPRSPKSSGNVPPASDPSGGAGAEVKPGNATAPA
ncbi:MAG: cell division protein FtsH, partial [Burkholderia sp.]